MMKNMTFCLANMAITNRTMKAAKANTEIIKKKTQCSRGSVSKKLHIYSRWLFFYFFRIQRRHTISHNIVHYINIHGDTVYQWSREVDCTFGKTSTAFCQEIHSIRLIHLAWFHFDGWSIHREYVFLYFCEWDSKWE